MTVGDLVEVQVTHRAGSAEWAPAKVVEVDPRAALVLVKLDRGSRPTFWAGRSVVRPR